MRIGILDVVNRGKLVLEFYPFPDTKSFSAFL
jgi:hypothetical protein